MKKIIAFGCLVAMGFVFFVVASLLILAFMAKPLPSTDEALATLSEEERESLHRLCSLAKIEAVSLRNIASYDGSIFDYELNRQSIVIRGGRVVALCLRETEFTALPDFSVLTALEALVLRGDKLTQWPDLSDLAALELADLSHQPLPDADNARFPSSIRRLRLAETKITDTTPLAKLTQLQELDLSGTPVSTFEPLIGLKLDTLLLARSQIATLPDKIPTHGSWKLDLDGTQLLFPGTYSGGWPFDGWISSTSHSGDIALGAVGKDKVEVTGMAGPSDKVRAINLPRCTDPNAPPVLLEVSCTGGKARVWLQEPENFFPSPWMTQGKVKGFGMLRMRGYLCQNLSPDTPASLRGGLFLTTHDRLYEMPPGGRKSSGKPPDWCNYSFYLEPLEGATVSGVSFKVRHAP